MLLSHLVQIHLLRFYGLGSSLHLISSEASEYAVVVFFILSGYLITHSLEINIAKHGRLRLGLYAAARIARLYPPLLYAIGLSLAVFAVLDIFALPGRGSPMSLATDVYAARDIIHVKANDIVNALSLMRGMLEINGPLWSLYIEAKLYILFACGIAMITGNRHILLPIIFIAITWTGISYNPDFLHYAAIWLTGALAYYACNGRSAASWSNRFIFLGTLIVCIIMVDGLGLAINDKSSWNTALKVVVSGAIAWLLFWKRLRFPIDARLADCSYSLYVTHFPIVLLAQSLLISSGSTSVSAAWCVAGVSFLVAMAIARIGGNIEARKMVVQNGLINLAIRLRDMRRV